MVKTGRKLALWRSEGMDLFILWLAVTVVGSVIVLAAADLFYPFLSSQLEAAHIGRTALAFWPCVIILHWATIASVVGYVAQQRCQKMAYWFFVSLIFTPVVAFIGLALVPVGVRPVEEPAGDEDEDEDDEEMGDQDDAET